MLIPLLYALAAVILIQCIYYLGIFGSLVFKKPVLKTEKSLDVPVSVIIWIKNNEQELRENLPYFLNQHYKTFQIVLINDASHDDSLEVMETFAAQHKNVKIVNVENNENFWGKKKYALTLGIKAATYEPLIFTSIDSVPESAEWLQLMVNGLLSGKSIVLGYSGYKTGKKSFLNTFSRFDNMLFSLKYLSLANIGIPYIGTGINMGYQRSIFFQANGFVKHLHLRTGEDHLFVNEMATKENTGIVVKPGSFIKTAPPPTFKRWFQTKRNIMGLVSFYQSKHKTILRLFSLSQGLFWLLSIILLAFRFQLWVVLAMLSFHFIIMTLTLRKASKMFNEPLSWMAIPFLEFFLMMNQFIIFILNSFSKPSHWR